MVFHKFIESDVFGRPLFANPVTFCSEYPYVYIHYQVVMSTAKSSSHNSNACLSGPNEYLKMFSVLLNHLYTVHTLHTIIWSSSGSPTLAEWFTDQNDRTHGHNRVGGCRQWYFKVCCLTDTRRLPTYATNSVYTPWTRL